MRALHLLQTIPGFEPASEPSAFFMFMLCLGAPILVGLLIIGWFLGKRGRSELARVNAANGLGDANRREVEGNRTSPKHALHPRGNAEAREVVADQGTEEVAGRGTTARGTGGAHAAN